MKICIVGNSSGLLKLELGSEIDKHDIVIRTNFKPFSSLLAKGYEKHIGTKTDIISYSFGRNFLKHADKINPGNGIRELLISNKYEIWLPLPNQSRFNEMLSTGVDPNNVKINKVTTYQNIIDTVYNSWWRKIPSCGISTIMMALDIFKDEDISIIGFDTNSEKEGREHGYESHYYEKTILNDNKPDSYFGHDWHSEGKFIDKLVEDGKIIWLQVKCDSHE